MNIPLNINLGQICLHFFNFCLLFAGLYFFLYNPVKKFMEKREDEYRQREEKTAENEKASEELLDKYNLMIKDADKEIADKRAEAIRIAEEEIDKEKAKAKADAEKMIAEAKAKNQRNYEQIMENAQKEISKMVITATDKIITAKDDNVYEAFLSAAKENSNE